MRCPGKLFSLVLGLVFASIARAAEPPAKSGEWEKLVAAAKAEGALAIYGAPEITMQNALQEFEKAYPEIKVSFVAGSGSNVVPRILAERRAEKYLLDAVVLGHSSTNALVQGKALDPIPPALLQAEVQNKARWWKSQHWYGDDAGQFTFIFAGYLTSPIAYNTKLFNPGELKSYWDLFNPKWKGRIVSFDPRSRGPITDVTTFFYYHPDLGANFLKRLYGETAAPLTADNRQGLDWLAQGKYALAVGLREVPEAKGKGLPVEELDAEKLKEGTYITPGFGALGLGNRAPHPSAAKLFVNWFLSGEGQSAWQKHTGNASLRKDIAKDYLPPNSVPKENGNYFFMALPEQKMDENAARKFVASVIK